MYIHECTICGCRWEDAAPLWVIHPEDPTPCGHHYRDAREVDPEDEQRRQTFYDDAFGRGGLK